MSNVALAAFPVVVHQFDDITLRSYLPPGWKVTNYKKNHHFIELEDADGNVHHLEAKSLVKGTCQDCTQTIYVESRLGEMVCPHCSGAVDWMWGGAKLSFIPDPVSRFATIPPGRRLTEPVDDDDIAHDTEDLS